MPATALSSVEKPALNDSEPVDCSCTSTFRIVLSGAVPGSCVTVTRLKYCRARIFFSESSSNTLLNASPSDIRICRRTTLSSVRELPVMLIRST